MENKNINEEIPDVKFSTKSNKSDYEKKIELELLLKKRNRIYQSMGYELDNDGNIIKRPSKLRQ